MKEENIRKQITFCYHQWVNYSRDQLGKMLYDYVIDDCVKVALAILKNRVDAEEVISITMERIFKLSDEELIMRLYSSPSIIGYFRRATVNNSLNYITLRRRRRVKDITEYSDGANDSVIASRTDLKLLPYDLEKALANLSDRERKIFTLKEIQGYSHQDIAYLGVVKSATNSSTILMRAKRKLQVMLVAYDYTNN